MDKSDLNLRNPVHLLLFIFMSITLLGLAVWGYNKGSPGSIVEPLLSFGNISAMIVACAIYLLPIYIAYSHKHSDLKALIVVDLLLGWTFIGWIACMVWSGNDSRRLKMQVQKDIEKLSTKQNNSAIEQAKQ